MAFRSLDNSSATGGAAGLEALARALLSTPVRLEDATNSPSDFDLNPDAPKDTKAPLAPAAVLIPILTGRESLHVLLTERTAHLSKHAGQIAFPGGRIDPEDDGPLAAALREAEEEIGLNRKFVEPLGFIEPYRTGTGFLITPVVAAIRPGFELRIEPQEVARVFEVPLDFLMDENNHRIDQRFWRGADRRFYAMPYGEHYIWGATAGIIRTLHRRVRAT